MLLLQLGEGTVGVRGQAEAEGGPCERFCFYIFLRVIVKIKKITSEFFLCLKKKSEKNTCIYV